MSYHRLHLLLQQQTNQNKIKRTQSCTIQNQILSIIICQTFGGQYKNLAKDTNASKIVELEKAVTAAKESLEAKTVAKDVAVKALDDYLKSIPKDDTLATKQAALEKEIAGLQKDRDAKEISYNKLVAGSSLEY